MDNIKVIRTVTYTGPRDLVEKQVEQSLHGSRCVGKNNSIKITAATVSIDIISLVEEKPPTATDLLLAKIRTQKTADYMAEKLWLKLPR